MVKITFVEEVLNCSRFTVNMGWRADATLSDGSKIHSEVYASKWLALRGLRMASRVVRAARAGKEYEPCTCRAYLPAEWPATEIILKARWDRRFRPGVVIGFGWEDR